MELTVRETDILWSGSELGQMLGRSLGLGVTGSGVAMELLEQERRRNDLLAEFIGAGGDI